MHFNHRIQIQSIVSLCVLLFCIFKISKSIDDCLTDTTHLRFLYDAIRNERDFSNDRPWMKQICGLIKWPMTFVFCAMITIAVIRRFAVKNQPDVF